MNFFNEYALLFAVATPVVAIIGTQVYLYLSGERGTLLFPGLGGYPSIECASRKAEVVAIPARRETSVVSNDAIEREAA